MLKTNHQSLSYIFWITILGGVAGGLISYISPVLSIISTIAIQGAMIICWQFLGKSNLFFDRVFKLSICSLILSIINNFMSNKSFFNFEIIDIDKLEYVFDVNILGLTLFIATMAISFLHIHYVFMGLICLIEEYDNEKLIIKITKLSHHYTIVSLILTVCAIICLPATYVLLNDVNPETITNGLMGIAIYGFLFFTFALAIATISWVYYCIMYMYSIYKVKKELKKHNV